MRRRAFRARKRDEFAPYARLQGSLAKRLHRVPSVAARLEGSKAEFRITLGKLREAADALGCHIVYALVPKNASTYDLAQEHLRKQAAENVRAVEHSMKLENQAVGRDRGQD